MKIKDVISDLFILLGVSSLAFGLYQIHPPLAYIVTGIVIAGFGYLLGSES